jgi:hypothetical protein
VFGEAAAGKPAAASLFTYPSTCRNSLILKDLGKTGRRNFVVTLVFISTYVKKVVDKLAHGRYTVCKVLVCKGLE